MKWGVASVRVGAHFIKRQDADCYYGLDLVSDFFDIGADIIGDLRDDKQARLGVIGEHTGDAVAWAPDLVFTTRGQLAHSAGRRSRAFCVAEWTWPTRMGRRWCFQAYLSDEAQRFAQIGLVEASGALLRADAAVLSWSRRQTMVIWPSNGFEIEVQLLSFEKTRAD